MDMSLYRKIIAARDDLLDNLNNGARAWSSCAAIAIVFDDSHHISPNQVCHAGLRNDYRGNKPKGAHAVVSALMKPKASEEVSEEEAIMFLDWLLNRSPYSSVFITKSAHEALFHKTIIASAHHPSNLMAAGLVASRRLWEYAYIAKVFCDLVRAGVHEDLAYYLGHLYSGRFDGEGPVSYKGHANGHCSLDSNMTAGALLNFLNHNVTRPNSTYHESWVYTGYAAMYNTADNALSVHAWINVNFPYKKAEKAKAFNPFPLDWGRDAAKECDYDHLIKATAEFQHKLFEFIGYKQEAKKEAA